MTDQGNDPLEIHIRKASSALEQGRLRSAIDQAIHGYLLAQERTDSVNATILLAVLHRALGRAFERLKNGETQTSNTQLTCSFCGEEREKGDLVAGASAWICRACVGRANSLLEEDDSA